MADTEKDTALPETAPLPTPDPAPASIARPTEMPPTMPDNQPSSPSAPVTVRRSRLSGAAMLLSLVALAGVGGGGAAAWFLFLQPLQLRVAALESRQNQNESTGSGTRDDIATRLSRLEAQIHQAPTTASTAAPTGPAPTAQADGGDRLAAIEQQLGQLKTSAADAEQVAKHLSEIQVAAGGRELLAQSIRDIQASMAATQGEVDRVRTQLNALGPRIEQIEGALADRRQQALKSEAMILALGQLRAAAGDGKPFAKELTAVKTLAGPESDMGQALDQLAPYADDGAQTMQDLQRGLAGLAPEIVRGAIVGKGDSWWRQALYHVASVVSIRRVGSTVPGDQADAVVARAQGLVEEDDLAGAITALQGLTGLPAQTAAPWLQEAKARLAVNAAEDELTRLAISRLASGASPGAPAAPTAASQP